MLDQRWIIQLGVYAWYLLGVPLKGERAQQNRFVKGAMNQNNRTVCKTTTTKLMESIQDMKLHGAKTTRGLVKKSAESTKKAGGSTKKATSEQKAMTKKATKILTKKLGRQPTEAEVAKKANALVKKANPSAQEEEEEVMGFGV